MDDFQLRAGIVPSYLRSSIERRAKWDSNFYNFQPTTFQHEATDNATVLDPGLSLDRVLEVFLAANEGFDGGRPETTWNTLVHWPTFQLALGAILDGSKGSLEKDRTQEQEHQVRVCAMPCTRLKGNQRGKMIIDYCMFIEPQNEDLAKLIEPWKHQRLNYNINHTDHYLLRQRPVVLSAEYEKPGEGFKEA